MNEFAIKVKNRKQLDKATEILKKQGFTLPKKARRKWIEKHINWAFEKDTAFVLVYGHGVFGYHNHSGVYEIIKYKKFKNQYK